MRNNVKAIRPSRLDRKLTLLSDEEFRKAVAKLIRDYTNQQLDIVVSAKIPKFPLTSERQADQIYALSTAREAAAVQKELISLFPIGIYPAHLKVWSKTIKEEQKYDSTLTSFLRELGQNWQALKDREERRE